MTRRIVAFALCFCAALSVSAGMNRWTETSPAGGIVTGIVFDPDDPSIVYAATGAGVFKSWNRGEQWYWMGRGYGGTSARAMAFDHASPRGLYVTGDHGVYRSLDRGATWSMIYSSIGDAIVVDPTNPSIIYVAAPGPVRKTVDGGANWTTANSGMGTGSIVSLAIDPRNPWTLYASSTSGIYRSTDAAASWTRVVTTTAGAEIIVSPADSTVYAAMTGIVMRSTDGGSTWRTFDDSSGVPRGIVPQAIALDPSAPATVWVGGYDHLIRSTNGGLSWSEINRISLGRDDVCAIAVSPQSSSQVLLGTYFDGIWRYTGELRFTPLSEGLYADRLHSIVVDPNDDDTIYATNRFSLYKSTDHGETWEDLDVGSAEYVAVDPRDSRKVYVAAYGSTYASTDAGAHFTKYENSLPDDAEGLVIGNDGVLFVALRNRGVYRSSSAAASWVASNSGISGSTVNSLAIVPGSTPVLYATTASGLYRSNGGSAWSPLTALACDSASVVAADATDARRIFVSTSCGFFRSLDGGASFTQLDMGANPSKVIAGPGSTVWAFVNRGTGGSSATRYARVYLSIDNGATWSRWRAGVRFANVQAATIDKSQKSLWLATYGTGAITLTPSYVVLPVAASLHGINSFFHSDAMVMNTSFTETQRVWASYVCLSGPCGTQTFTLQPREARTFDDIVVSLFGKPETGGTISFGSTEHLVVTSRLYTPSKPAPTTGQFVPGLTEDESYGAAAMPSLSFKGSGAGGFRTNVGVFNIAGEQDVTFALYAANGTLLGNYTTHLGAWRGVQINNVFGAAGVTYDVPNAYCVITSARDKGLFGYASVLDNQSQDPVFVRGCNAHDGITGTTVIPAAASLHGINTFFHSDVSVLNVATSGPAANVTATYHPFSGAPITRTFSVPARTTAVFDDIVGSLFGAPESGGAIELTTSGRIAVTSRLYTPSKPAPTYGQFVHGMRADDAYPRAVLTSLSYATSGGFRTNVGAYNFSDVAQTIRFELYAANGTKLGETTRDVAARQPVQINNIFAAVGVTQSVAAAYCVVSSTVNTPLFAYASVLDNQSQDPIFVYGQTDPDWE